MTVNINSQMKKTIQLALMEAGKILLDNFGKLLEYTLKENQSSIVTAADVEAEKKIMQIIEKDFPEHNTLGEETGFMNRISKYTWVVDPLDGTSNFAAGLPWFGVIICVMKYNRPMMSGCLLPLQNQIYFAEKGKGATMNGVRISVSKEVDLKNILVAYSLDPTNEPGKTEHEAQIIQRLVGKVRNLRSTNCLLDLCYTADGKLGACINQTTKIWDIAGTGLIIEEAGGLISDIRGRPVLYTLDEKSYAQNYTIVGSNKMLHSKVIELINQ